MNFKWNGQSLESLGIETKSYKKPPIGIMPRYIWEEKRFFELRECIYRFLSEGLEIRIEWIDEYNELSKKVFK